MASMLLTIIRARASGRNNRYLVRPISLVLFLFIIVLRSYDFDQLFIGADGIDLARGSTTFNELVGLSQVMAEVSREVVVMVESQKIGRKMPNLELTWQQIDVLITDTGLSEQDKQAILAHGVEVICV